ncbi:MAG: Methyltransferase, FkbM family [Ferruginibacter sp.]|nr:Methyltransferase, FkbM family [Ferruginibacter sp.]
MIKKILAAAGFELRKLHQSNVMSAADAKQQHRDSMEKSLLFLKESGFDPAVVIDIGAGSGTLPLLQTFPDAKHILIEPLIEFEPQLSALQKSFKVEFIFAAVGTGKEAISINVHKDLYGSSLLKEQDGPVADGTPRKVPMISLDSLHEKIPDPPSSLVIKIDVQGAELDVLRSGPKLLQQADLVIMECSFFNFLHNAPDITDVICFMKEQGFVMYDIYDFHNRPIDGALGQADISFVKADGCFRSSHNWTTENERRKALQ